MQFNINLLHGPWLRTWTVNLRPMGKLNLRETVYKNNYLLKFWNVITFSLFARKWNRIKLNFFVATEIKNRVVTNIVNNTTMTRSIRWHRETKGPTFSWEINFRDILWKLISPHGTSAKVGETVFGRIETNSSSFVPWRESGWSFHV